MIYDLIIGRKISGVETHYNCEFMQRKEVAVSSPAEELNLLKMFLMDCMQENGGLPDPFIRAAKNIIELEDGAALNKVAEYLEAINYHGYGVFVILRTDMDLFMEVDGGDLTYLVDPARNGCHRISSGIGNEYIEDHPDLPTALMDFFEDSKITFDENVNNIIDMDFNIKQYQLMRDRDETRLFDMSSIYTMVRNLGYDVIIVLNAMTS